MDQEYIIITAGDSFIQEFDRRMEWIKQRGYRLSTDSHHIESAGLNCVSLQINGCSKGGVFRDDDIVYIFRHQLSEILAEHILNDWENQVIWREITRSCRNLSADDRQTIYRKSSHFLKKCHDSESLNMLMNYGRKNRIAHRLFTHLEESFKLVVEGFINFCMRDYLTEVKFSVEVAREELRNEKEYSDFVNLLRYFVDSQIPRMHEVNLMIGDNGVFYLWDGEGTEIEENYMNYYLEDVLLDEIDLDDVLISILITIAPRRIILHNIGKLPQSEPVEMIRSVFKEKIIECRGCERCYGHAPGTDCKQRS